MTLQFPNIKPASLSFTPATYNVAKPDFHNNLVSPRLLASKPSGPKLLLSFRSISADNIYAIFNVWELSYSGFYEMTLPAEITSSINSTEFAHRMGSDQLFMWRFSSEPSLSNMTAGVGDISVELEGVLYGTSAKIPDTWIQQSSPDNSEGWFYDATQVITGDDGSIYVYAAFSITNVNSWIKIIKFSASGVLRWSKDFNKSSGLGQAIVSSGVPSIAVGSSTVIFVANTGNPRSTKVICLNSSDGSVLWAKAITLDYGPYDGYQFIGLHLNKITGYVYLTYFFNGYFGSYPTDGIVTLTASGNLINCVDIGDFRIKRIHTKPDGSIILNTSLTDYVYGQQRRRGVIFGMDASAASITTTAKAFGSLSSWMPFNMSALLSSGKLVVSGGHDTYSLHIIDPNTGNIDYSVAYANVYPLQLIEKADGNIAMLGWVSSVLSVNNQWTAVNSPQEPTNCVLTYSPNLSQIVDYRAFGINLARNDSSVQDHVRLAWTASPSLNRYIGMPGYSNFALISTNLKPTYYRYPCIQNYMGTGVNSFAKFGSATSGIPFATSAVSPPAIASVSLSLSSRTPSISDYSLSITVTQSSTPWQYFTNQ